MSAPVPRTLIFPVMDAAFGSSGLYSDSVPGASSMIVEVGRTPRRPTLTV